MAGADLARLRTLATDVWTLWQRHPRLQPVGLALRKSLRRRWGGWPLDPKAWARLGLPRGSGGLVYRRADGVTVLAFRTGDLPHLLRETTRAVRRLGSRTIEPLRRTRVGSRDLWVVDGTWSCGLQRGVALCADVGTQRWAQVVRAPARSLWSGPLRQVPARHLDAPLGAWLSPKGIPGVDLAGLAKRWAGWTPQGLWAHLTPGRKLGLGAYLLRSPASAKTRTPTLPPLGSAGLAAALGAQLSLRLRLPPGHLVAQLRRIPGRRALQR
jgi:hypothetical protein